MARPAKYTDEQIIQVVQDILSDSTLGRPSYQKIAEEARRRGFDIGEQVFRKRKEVVKLIEEMKERYKHQGENGLEAAYVSFDVQGEMMKIRSEYGMQRLIDVLTEREAYFRQLYDRNCELVGVVRGQLQQIIQLTQRVQELESERAESQKTVAAYKHRNAKLNRQNSRLKAVLEEQIYQEMVLAELDEMGLHVERSKMPNAIRDQQVSEGIKTSHADLADKLIPFCRAQSRQLDIDILAEDLEEEPEDMETVAEPEDAEFDDASMDLMTEMLRKLDESGGEV